MGERSSGSGRGGRGGGVVDVTLFLGFRLEDHVIEEARAPPQGSVIRLLYAEITEWRGLNGENDKSKPSWVEVKERTIGGRCGRRRR